MIPSLELLRDLPLRIPVPDDLRDAIFECVATSTADSSSAAQRIERAEAVTLRAIAFIESEAARLTQEQFASEDAGALRRRLVEEPRQRAEAIVDAMQQHVASDRPEWSRRLDKQTRDVLETMRRELATLELEPPASSTTRAVAARRGFRDRFARWADAAMDAWTAHLTSLVEARYVELVRFDLDALEAVLGVRLEAAVPTTTMPVYRVQIADALYAGTVEPPSLAAAVFGPFKGGLDVVALLAGLLVVPLVGRLMDESPILVRVTVVGGMILAALIIALVSGLRTQRRLVALGVATARAEIIRAIDATFSAQVERFRADIERHCAGSVREGLRGTLRAIEPAVRRFVEQRESAAVTTLANAQLKLDRIADRLRGIRAVKYALEEQLLVDLRRARAHV